MLARIAHELFWLGRHMARAEHTARMLDGVFQTDLAGSAEDPRGIELTWPGLLAILGARADGAVGREDALARLTLEEDEPASLISCVSRAREGARTVRDVISADMWEVVNTTDLVLHRHELSGHLLSSPYSVYRYVKERSALFWGLTARTMLRDEANSFLAAGGRIESADMVLRMLRVALPVPGEEDEPRTGQAQALLAAVGGLQAFRRAVPSPPNAIPVARFLLYERSYPDSVAASVTSAERALEDADPAPRNSAPVLRLSRLSAELEFRRRADEPDTDLVRFCEQVQRELSLVDGDIAGRYFATAAPPTHAA